MSGVPSHGDPTHATPGPPVAAAGGDDAPGAGAGPGPEGALGERVREALDGLDEADLAAHPAVFEALGAAIVDELRSLEEL